MNDCSHSFWWTKSGSSDRLIYSVGLTAMCMVLVPWKIRRGQLEYLPVNGTQQDLGNRHQTVQLNNQYHHSLIQHNKFKNILTQANTSTKWSHLPSIKVMPHRTIMLRRNIWQLCRYSRSNFILIDWEIPGKMSTKSVCFLMPPGHWWKHRWLTVASNSRVQWLNFPVWKKPIHNCLSQRFPH